MNIGRRGFVLIVFVLFIIFSTPVYAYNFSFVDKNNTVVNEIFFDYFNNSYGNHTSHTYKDNSIINQNLYLRICTESGEVINSSFFSIAYSFETGQNATSLLTLPIYINYQPASTCINYDIDFSTYGAFSPGIPFLIQSDNQYFSSWIVNSTYDNVTNTTTNYTYYIPNYTWNRTSLLMNGTYTLGIGVDDTDHSLYFTVKFFSDHLKRAFEPDWPVALFLSLYSSNGTIVEEHIGGFDVASRFTTKLTEGFIMLVNGIEAFRVKPLDPCSPINESGYYIFNDSRWNYNETCQVINQSNVILDFGNKTIDGDNTTSIQNDACALIIKDTENITVVDLRTQQFRFGLCIFNSKSIHVSGTSSQDNLYGIYISNSSAVFADSIIVSNAIEIVSVNDSYIEFADMISPSANFSIRSKDTQLKSVLHPPADPEDWVNVSQWINLSKTNSDSWAMLDFNYQTPLPNSVWEPALWLWKWNNNTGWNMVASITPEGIMNNKISSGNVSNFSIFAPLGIKLPEQIKNETIREIQPQIEQQQVPPEPQPPELDLRLIDDVIVLQQGETGSVSFELENIGDIPVADAAVSADVKKGWDKVDKSFPMINLGEIKKGRFYLTVYSNEIPGEYQIPVRAIVKGDLTVDMEFLTVKVIPRQVLKRMTIIESPLVFSVFESSGATLPILVENTGDINLTGIQLSIEGAEDCLTISDKNYDLNTGERKALTYSVRAKSVLGKCEGVLLLVSDEGAIAFSPIVVKIVPSLISGFMLLPFLFIGWTILLVILFFRRRRRLKLASTPNLVKVPET